MRAVRFFDGALSLTLVLASRRIRSSLAGRVQCREHPCGGGLVGAQQNHQHVDEKAFAVRPLQIRCPISARTRREPQRRACQSPAWRQLADIHGKSVRTCRPVNLIVRLRHHGSISKDIGSRLGERCSAITTGKMALSGYFLAGVPLFSTTSCHTRASWHSV
jgi:hypothetical protein